MGLKCKIKEIEGMKIPMQGNQMDPLYRSLLEYYKDDSLALESWAKVNSIDSIEELAIFEGGQVGSELAKIIDQSIGNQEIIVSEREKFDILYLAVTNGFSSLLDFSDKLTNSLKPNGYFDLSAKNLMDSRLFTIIDIENISLENLVDVVNKTEALVSQGDIEVPQQETPTNIFDNDRRTAVGGSRKLTLKDMLDEVLQVASRDFLSLEEAIEQIGYQELANVVDYDKFEELSVIQEVDPSGDTLDLNFNQSRKVLENTLLEQTSTTDLEADIDFISRIDSDVWNRKAGAVYGVTKEIELDLAKKGVDIIGLADMQLPKEELVLFLKTVQSMLDNPSTVAIDAFYAQLDIINDKESLRPEKGSAKLMKVFASSQELDLVEVNSDMSLTDLYVKHGLVKFRDNLFFKVQKESKDILYEKMYQKYTNGGLGIENNDQKAEVLSGITDLVNTYRSTVDETIREEYTLYRLLSQKATTEEVRVQDTTNLSTVTTDPDYLKTEFISDFHKYVLEEKFANSEMYNRVLKNIKITDAGIIVQDSVTTLQGIRYRKELEDYIKLRRGNFGNHLISNTNLTSFVDRDLYYLNNKNKIREIQTQYRTSGNFLATRENSNLYVKVGNTIYRKAASKDGNDLYAKVRGNLKDNIFYDTNTNFDTDIEEMFNILNNIKVTTSEYKKPELETVKKEIRYQMLDDKYGLARTQPVGFTYDTDLLARERFNLSTLTQIGKGSDRTVFKLEDGKVLKIAHSPRGLRQNEYEGDFYLTQIVPEVFERGLNYVVVQDTPRLSNKDLVPVYNEDGEEVGQEPASEMIKELKNFNQLDFDRKETKLLNVLDKYGLSDITSYEVLYGDFSSIRNWGFFQGMPVHLDGGTFAGVSMIKEFQNVKPLQDEDFRKIYQRSRSLKKAVNDTDNYTKFQKGFGVSSTKENIRQVIDKLKQTGLAENVFELNTEQLKTKLKELGVSDDIAMQVIAWHGTPHSFDRFTTDKMGTGEGVQAFGWGLYFTDLESIARNYAVKLSDLEINGTSFTSILESTKGSMWNPVKVVQTYNLLKQKALDNNTPITDFNTLKQFIESDYLYEWANGLLGQKRLDKEVGSVDGFFNFAEDILQIAKGNKKDLKPSRNLYKVSLHQGKTSDQYAWLEWDKPMSDKDLELFQKFNKQQGIRLNQPSEPVEREDRITAGQMYKFIADKVGQETASLFLLENGIDGVKFPAESIARGATSDTARGFNYVVFDENTITIEEQIQFRKALAQQGIDLIPNGFVINKEVYLNSDTIDNSTPIHEFTHLFNKWTKQNRPDIYKKGIELIEQELQKENSEIQDVIDYVKQTQPNLTGERFTEEILTEFVGRYSSQMMDEQKEKSSLMNWLSDFWNSIKEMLGITNMSPEQVANLSLQEYARATVSDLLRGENIFAEKSFKSDIESTLDSGISFQKELDENINEKIENCG